MTSQLRKGLISLSGSAGKQLLGHLPAAPAGAHAEYALGAGVEDDVAAAARRTAWPATGAAASARGLVGVARHRLGDLRADAGAREQAAPAVPQVLRGALADLLGHSTSRSPGRPSAPAGTAPEAAERQPDQEQHGEATPTAISSARAQRARPLVLALGERAAQLEGAEPEQHPGQEQQPEDHHHDGQPGVALPCGCGWPPGSARRRSAARCRRTARSACGRRRACRICTARENASPRLGSNSDSRGAFDIATWPVVVGVRAARPPGRPGTRPRPAPASPPSVPPRPSGEPAPRD